MINKAESFDLLVSKTTLLKGTLKAPPSKSYTHRAIIIGSLDGTTRITNPLYSDDTEATIDTLRKLGAKITEHNDCVDIVGFDGKPSLKNRTINVKESGTLLRFILSILPYTSGRIEVTGTGTLCNRPNTTIVDALKSMGVEISGKGNNHTLPITLNATGELPGGNIEVDGRMSSQVISSLLISAPLAKRDTAIKIKNTLVSKPYIDITIDVLKSARIEVENNNYRIFRIKAGQKFHTPEEFVIHGDYSSIAFIVAASCLIDSEVVIKDLVQDKQGDRKIIEILNTMGAEIEHKNDEVRINGPYKLKGIEIDGCDIPDLVPILTVIGTFADNKTRIYNISHLAYKESNRITTTVEELRRLGAKFSFVSNDEIVVEKSNLSYGVIYSHNDHRIAMAFSVVGLRIGELKIKNGECITKSYLAFVDDMKKIGAKIRRASSAG